MSEINSFTGKLIVIDETNVISERFQKRQIVIDDMNEQYPQTIPFDFVQDKCDLVLGYNLGDIVTVNYNIRGNEYNGKYYVNLQAWSINKNRAADPAFPESRQEAEPIVKMLPSSMDDEFDDDIPF